MRNVRAERLAFWVLLAVLAALFFVVPSVGLPVFASPDETAVAITAREIGTRARAFIAEPLALAYPWIHPRSWVSVGPQIAPVGFLAWPLLLAAFAALLGTASLPILGMLLILSSVWPFYQMLRKQFGERAAFWGALVAYTFPSVIVYANRSLFSNAAFFAFAVWLCWFLVWMKTERRPLIWYVLGSMLVTTTFAIRPSEWFWFLPWFVWSAQGLRIRGREWAAVAMGFVLVSLPIAWLASSAYGSWWGVGYFLHDNTVPVLAETGSVAATASGSPLFFRWLPYGLHPRIMWWNVKTYVWGFLWPWIIPLLIAVTLWVMQLKRDRRFVATQASWLAGFWMMGVLIVMYGSGFYTDNIQGVPSMGNSFLRYLMPMGALVGMSIAWLWDRRQHPNWKLAMKGLVAAVALFGVYHAMIADAEGMFSTRKELARYQTIRTSAHQWFDASSVIVSDRSDKIFFPDFRATSPVPVRAEVGQLARTGVKIGYFGRPMSQAEKDAWRDAGLDAQELAFFGREVLYRLVRLNP